MTTALKPIKTGYDVGELMTADNLFKHHPELEGNAQQGELGSRAGKLQAIIDDTREKHSNITGSLMGEAEKMRAVVALMTGVVERVKKEITNLMGLDIFRKFSIKREQLLSANLTLAMPKEWQEYQLREHEADSRAEIRKLPDLERRSLLFEAVGDDDRITLRAFRFCAPRFPLVTREDLEEALDMHSRNLYPEAWEQCDGLEALWSLCRGNFDTFCRVLVGLAGRGSDEAMKDLRAENLIPAEVTAAVNPYQDPALARR